MMPGMPGRRTHDYFRHGITSLFAAFNIADGTVISELHRRHRAIEFRKFLVRIDKAVPADLDVHLVCDNYATHNTAEIKTWLARHPRFHVHFTPAGQCRCLWAANYRSVTGSRGHDAGYASVGRVVR
jgi:hypothetical protein